MAEVRAGSDLRLDLRLEAVMEGVLVTGAVRAQVVAECVRCLGPVREALGVELQELYAYQPPADGDDVSQVQGDCLDLEPVVRDALLLALPLNPVCAPDCPGLCADCGARLADDPGHGHEPVTDARWATLRELVKSTDKPGWGRSPGPEEE